MLFKKLNQLEEEYFIVLRGPLESGRQSPDSMGGALILSIFLHGLFIVIMSFIIVDGYINTFIFTCIIAYITVIGLIIILSIIFAIPSVYRKYQKMQYFITIIVSQTMFGLSLLPFIFYLLYEELLYGYSASDYDISELEFLIFICSVFAVGIIVLIVAYTRFCKLLQKGKFKAGTRRDEIRSYLEVRIPSMKSFFIAAGTSFSLSTVAIVSIFHLQDLELALMFGLGITLFLL